MKRTAGVRRPLVLGIVGAIVVAGGAVALVAPWRSPHVTGDRVDRILPPLSLLDQNGHAVSLAEFRGKVVVLTPFLSLCAEVCPITQGAFLELRRELGARGLGSRVELVEVTVDPGRDTPARLRAFARMTGISWPLLTGTPAQIAAFWKFFGIGYMRTPAGSPPAIDWWTHLPQTYDVAHEDAVFFLDARGHERIVIVGMPSAGPSLPPHLRRLLDSQGLQNLRRPELPWTAGQALDDVRALLP